MIASSSSQMSQNICGLVSRVTFGDMDAAMSFEVQVSCKKYEGNLVSRSLAAGRCKGYSARQDAIRV